MSDPLLDIDNIEVRYDRHFLAIKGVSLAAREGNVVSLLGPNGAGKSTVLKAISGLLATERGRVTAGSITYDDEPIANEEPKTLVDRGITHVLEDRRVFEELTVEENLRCGLYRKGNRIRYSEDEYELAFEYFPQLRDYMETKAGYISGGEQQMLVIATALLYRPRLLLLDEPSLGLAPQLVEQIYDTVEEINRNEDITIIIADQNADLALGIADYGYVIENGEIKMHDSAENLLDREEIKEFYLGIGEDADQNKYGDIKHYKRRKRWT